MKKNVLRLLAVLLTALLLNGCASSVSVLKPGEAAETGEDWCYLYGTHVKTGFGLNMAQLFFSPKFYLWIKHESGQDSPQNLKLVDPMPKSDVKGLFVYKLRPGRYRLYKISVDNYMIPRDSEFELHGGTVNYMGSITIKRNFIALMGRAVSLSRSDDEDYDKKILLENHPGLINGKFERLVFK